MQERNREGAQSYKSTVLGYRNAFLLNNEHERRGELNSVKKEKYGGGDAPLKIESALLRFINNVEQTGASTFTSCCPLSGPSRHVWTNRMLSCNPGLLCRDPFRHN